MWRKAFFLLPFAAAVLVSCATTADRKPASTPAPNVSDEQRAPSPKLAAPAPAPEEESIQPPVPSAEQPPAPDDAALALPQVPHRPQTVTAEDELSPPESAHGPERFPMTSPQPPAAPRPAAQEPRRPAAPEPRRPAQLPRASAPQAQTQAGKGDASAAAAASDSAQASASSSTASSGSAAPSTYGRLREIYARVGDDVQISLDGPGFLFLGFPDRSPNGDGMSFTAKETKAGKTVFTFRALKLGSYDLDFLQQDNASGSSQKETVRVHVVSDADFASAVTGGTGPAAGGAPAETGDPAFADRLAALGQYDAAIAELLKGYQQGNPDLDNRLARLYMRTGSWDAAGKYFTKNLSAPSPYADAAVVGLVQVAIAQDDQQQLLSLLKKLLLAKDPGLEETLIAAVRYEKKKGQIGVGLDLASEYGKRYPDGRWIDEDDFILAQLLEADSPFRDIARARTIYRAILAEHPESPFAQRARDRVDYLDRHFFEVR